MKRDIRSLRAYHNITQQQVADAIGVSVHRVRKIEANQEIVSFKQLLDIYHYLGYDLIVEPLKEEG